MNGTAERGFSFIGETGTDREKERGVAVVIVYLGLCTAFETP
jgi:hypothetical protein